LSLWLRGPGRRARVPSTSLPRQDPEGTQPPTFTNPFGMEFVRVPRGKFWSPRPGVSRLLGNEVVEVPYTFYLGAHEVTQGPWRAVPGGTPSWFSRTGDGRAQVKDFSEEELKRFPVELVTWYDAQRFLATLNRRAPETGWAYCLPTPVEWEYACRG